MGPPAGPSCLGPGGQILTIISGPGRLLTSCSCWVFWDQYPEGPSEVVCGETVQVVREAACSL